MSKAETKEQKAARRERNKDLIFEVGDIIISKSIAGQSLVKEINEEDNEIVLERSLVENPSSKDQKWEQKIPLDKALSLLRTEKVYEIRKSNKKKK